jgi:transcriptional regulator with XRE-family HTH domain
MYQTKIEGIVIRLKKAKHENPEMTLQKISDQTGVSMSTVTRIFADGSENQSFRYESLKPIALLLLGSDGLDEEIDPEELQMQISEIKEKYEKKLEKEREQHRRNVEFLKNQIMLKDDRITRLLDAIVKYQDLLEKFISNINI